MFPLIPAIPALMTTVATALSSISTFIVTYGPTILKTLQTVQQVIGVVAKVLDVLNPQDSVSDIGSKALQAEKDGIKPENFDEYQDYINQIRSIQVNPEIATQYSETEKTLTGIAITSHAIEDKLGLPRDSIGILCCMIALNADYFTDKRINTWLDAGLDLGKVIAYFSNDLGFADTVKTEEKLIRLDSANRSEYEVEQELEQVKTDLYQARQSD